MELIMPNTFSGKGNLADSPSLKTIMVKGEARTVAEMRVFFDEFSYNEQGDIEQDGGFFMSVSLWGKKGEEAARLLRKGARVKVDGRLQQFLYKDKDTGKELPAFQIAADDINLSLSRVEKVEFRAKREQPVEQGGIQHAA
jgi:single-strand DNA-binding protein